MIYSSYNNATGPPKTGHICPNYTCIVKGAFCGHCLSCILYMVSISALSTQHESLNDIY